MVGKRDGVVEDRSRHRLLGRPEQHVARPWYCALKTPARSEVLALVFLAALDLVVAAGGSRLVLFAL